MDVTDAELLRRYTCEGAESAFRELVQRHINLVYAVAWRHLRSHALAADVTQSVFTDLARSARSLSSGQPLVAWFHVVARRTAIDVIRTEQRRHAREQAAAEIAAIDGVPSAWRLVEPLLDEGLETLDIHDRHALLLRFFENRSLRDVGVALGTSDDAAQKRVSRALEQLRTHFIRRGVSVTVAGLAVQLPAHAMVAPPGLAASVASASLTTTTVLAPTATVTVAKALMATSLVLAVGLVWEVRSLAAGRAQLDQWQQEAAEIGPLSEQARTGHHRAKVALEAARQQAEAGRARQADRIATESALDAWLARVDQLKALIRTSPAKGIPEMRYLTAADWLAVTRDNPLQTDMQQRRALADLRRIAKFRPEINQNLAAALRALSRRNNGRWPEGTPDLRPYLTPSLDDDILARYEFTTADSGQAIGNGAAGARVFQDKAAVDEDFDIQVVYYESGGISNRPFDHPGPLSAVLQKAYAGFRAANPSQIPAQPEQLLPFLPDSVDPTMLKDFWEARRLPLAQ